MPVRAQSDRVEARKGPAGWMAGLLTSLVLYGCVDRQPPKAVGGVLDLRAWDLAQDGAVPLNGEWEFYWQQLYAPTDFSGQTPKSDGILELPGVWAGHRLERPGLEPVTLTGEGYATFRLRILRANPQPLEYGLKIQATGTAYALWIDGVLVAKNGRVGQSRASMTPQYLPLVAFGHSQSQQLELVLQISNFRERHGGMWNRILFGTAEQVSFARDATMMEEMMAFGLVVVMGFYHLTLFGLRRRDRASLYFGLFCMVMALRVVTTGDRVLAVVWPDFNWELLVKLEFWTVYVVEIPVALLFHELFPKEFSKRAVAVIATVCCAFCGLVAVTPASVFTQTLVGFQLFVLAALCYSLVATARAVAHRREGAPLWAAGWVVFSVTVTLDFLSANLLVKMFPVFTLGFGTLVLTQAGILAIRFSRAFVAVETLSDRLNRANERLNDQIQVRSRQLFTALSTADKVSGAAEELKPGDKIRDTYVVNKVLGEGGMGKVYLATRLSDQLLVAVKFPKTSSSHSRARLAREAMVGAQITHPNIVRILDVDLTDSGLLYVVLEHVDGASVAALRKRYGDVAWAIPLLRQVCEGLAVLHQHGIIHRDLKPENVLVANATQPGEVQVAKIADFGLSRPRGLRGPRLNTASSDDAMDMDYSYSGGSSHASGIEPYQTSVSKRFSCLIAWSDRNHTGAPVEARLQEAVAAAGLVVDAAGESFSIVFEPVDDDPPPSPTERNTAAGSAAALVETAADGEDDITQVLSDSNAKTPSSPGHAITEFGALTRFGTVAGTPPFIAPENLLGFANVTTQSDMFSFGVMAYYLCCGQLPFAEPPVLLLRQLRLVPKPRSLSDLVTDIDPAISDVVGRCLRLEPQHRPTAEEVALLLGRVGTGKVSPRQ